MLSLQRALCAASITVLMGCGTTPPTPTPTFSAEALSPSAGDQTTARRAASIETGEATEAEDLSGLPAAPWSAEPMRSEAAPSALLMAWSRAENRTSCAPIAPVEAGPADGARARVSGLIEGGWAVEFDRRGMPGMNARGATCRRCGRGVFGIAGTRMSPDELVGDADRDTPAPTFADGSHLEVEAPAEGESVAAATLTVQGQGCVYQVWSFLGEEHVRELVEGLRLVDTEAPPTMASR